MTIFASFPYFNEWGLVRWRYLSGWETGGGPGLDWATGCLRLGGRVHGWQAAFCVELYLLFLKWGWVELGMPLKTPVVLILFLLRTWVCLPRHCPGPSDIASSRKRCILSWSGWPVPPRGPGLHSVLCAGEGWARLEVALLTGTDSGAPYVPQLVFNLINFTF